MALQVSQKDNFSIAVFVAIYFLTILLSGCVQYINIYLLAAMNVSLMTIMYFSIGFSFHTLMTKPLCFLLLYLAYNLLITDSPSDFIYIIFRYHDFITAFLLINFILIRKISFEKVFEIIFNFILVYGFINFFVSNSLFGLFTPNESVKAWRFLFFYGMDETYYGIRRSQAFFWEPGIYQIYLNVFLFYVLFYIKNIFKSIIVSLAILLTLSTTGLLILAVQWVYYLFTKSRSFTHFLGKLLFLLPLVIPLLFFSAEIFIDKVSGDRVGSYIARSYDTRNGIEVALNNPMGIGFSPERYQAIAAANPYNLEAGLNTDRGQTNSIVMLFYTTGPIWAIAFLYMLWRQNVFWRHRNLFFFILALSLCTEPLFYSPFVQFFAISSLIKRNQAFILPKEKAM